MIKIGLISAATYGYMDAPRTPGSFHGTAFSTAFNGYDPEKSKQYQWTFAAASRTLAGAKIVKVWDPHLEWAERLADVCNIPEVCGNPEACAEGVDAVIVVDDGSGVQAKLGIPALRKGIPTFIDKPLAMTAKAAKEIIDIARQTGTPLMSASSLRFVPDVVKLKNEVASLGEVHLATTICGNGLVYYGIHALETAYAVLGSGAVSCLNVGQPGRNIVRVRFQNGRDLLLMVAEGEYMAPGYQINVYGKAGWRSVQPDLADLYLYLMEEFLGMVRTGKLVVPLDEMLEVISVLEAGERSLALGREVSVAEVLD
ncbi:MAG: Gfo/Idh/MocA family oxidoreductase [Armatimonadetes bacterium]|nr:Gfo/Idh/MocA family oxidoreductase [Armatimonadota bacterium]